MHRNNLSRLARKLLTDAFRSKRNLIFVILSLYSIFLTSLYGVWIYKHGGILYVEEQIGIRKPVQKYSKFQTKRIDEFLYFPRQTESIIFVGDSITQGLPWSEYFSNVKNRGVAGENSAGFLDRIKDIYSLKPKAVFINIGTNDLFQDKSAEYIYNNIMNSVEKIHYNSPKTDVFVISILPLNTEFNNSSLYKRKKNNIILTNDALRQGSTMSTYTYLDVSSRMADVRGNLSKEYTVDGTHLNALGNKVYAAAIQELVDVKRGKSYFPNGIQ